MENRHTELELISIGTPKELSDSRSSSLIAHTQADKVISDV